MSKYYAAAILILFIISGCCQDQPEFRNTIVAIEKGKFHGWPANNGVWHWGNEILVGYTQVEYAETGGHNIKPDSPQLSMLARSKDGGETWQMFDPEGYVGDPAEKTHLEQPVNFRHEGFAMRVFGDTYHGNADPEGGFYYSYDKGENWNGPYFLGDIAEHPEFTGMILTPRTDYVVLDENTCIIMVSARVPDTGLSDKTACIRTGDGGLTFEFLSWVVPLSDPYRAAMPQTVLTGDNDLVLAARRRVIENRDSCWIDAYHSGDGGRSWEFLNRIGVTGAHNGNPPALVRMDDGRLCCVYGNRSVREIKGRYSSDNGRTWGQEFVIRTNFYTGEDNQDMKDLGYPRLVQRPDGRLVAMYYWATKEHPEQHIAATIWRP
jgi:hypothetical protein